MKGCNYREDCDRYHWAKGLCHMHYNRALERAKKSTRVCTKVGCDRILKTKRDTCWEHKPKPVKPEKHRYVDSLIDELEIRGGSWPDLTAKYDRNIKALSEALRREDRMDLVKRVQYQTYGVIGRDNIISVVNGRNHSE